MIELFSEAERSGTHLQFLLFFGIFDFTPILYVLQYLQVCKVKMNG